MPLIRLFLADDHTLVRDSLRMLLTAQSDMEVVGEAGTANETIAKVRDLDVDIVCLDISMPLGSGLGIIEQLRRVKPKVRILVLTMHADPAYVHSAFAVGTDGYLVKSSPSPVLLEAVRTVTRGERFVDPSISYDPNELPPPGKQSPLSRLSDREREVLVYLAQGMSYIDIGTRLGVSVKTVETYRTRLGTKLGLRTRADLIRFALEAGILTSGGLLPPEE